MNVEWHIYDTLRRKVVNKFSTAGSSEVEATADGIDIAFDEAFALAAQNLLADNEFYELVRRSTSTDTQVASPSRLTSINDPEQRPGEAPPSVSSRLNQSVAVVRSSTGHGSGFVIGPGRLLTNEHVVGGASKVRLIFGDGAEIDGIVEAKDDVRDIAVVSFARTFIRKPLAISENKPKIGDDVLSYGAPLDESYSGSLRKGIVSAYRVLRGQEYIQSDVGINPGNSGGPLINASGEVVGVSVSGVLVGGSQQGINFFIPIDDALRSISSGTGLSG